MDDLARYLINIVEPTVDEFRHDPALVRRGFIACVVLDHAVDYLAFPGDRSQWDGKQHQTKRRELRKAFRDENPNFLIASDVANAFKHVKTTSPRKLEASEVYERPPAMGGRMVCGLSQCGDATGAVIVDGRDLLQVVEGALAFLHSKVRYPAPGNAVGIT
jgi:hypothetical protein